MGAVDQTMPALFTPTGTGEQQLTPVAQLGAGLDGTSVLAQRGSQLLELMQLSFGPESPQWTLLEARVRAASAIDHPGVRNVLGLEKAPPTVMLAGDRSPILAELVLQQSVDMSRALRILGELARAIAAAHHVGLVHGRLDPWAIQVGSGDRPSIELTGLLTRPRSHEWCLRCTAPEAMDGLPDPATDVFALGALLDIFATASGREPTSAVKSLIADCTMMEPEARPSIHQVIRRFIGEGTFVSRTTLEDEAIEPRNLRPAAGLVLGRFELARQLGGGAMGEVWEARDTTGGPHVALKLLRAEIAQDPELLRRFRKEARVLAKVGSPYIANYIDLNEDKGIHYLVLELVTGGSVTGAIRRLRKLPENLALAIVADACRALVEPHRLGIVHRDVKPDNMMFVRAGIELEPSASGQVIKLGDFGIARLVEATAGPEGATREGSVLGTPEYMSPEQCQGVTQVTPATDIYALGCCLYMLIAGRPPFQTRDDNPMGVILDHLRETPPRLDALAPEVNPAVAGLAAKCLEKDARNRHADASELLAAIEQLTTGSPALISAHPAAPVVKPHTVQTYSFEWELQSSPDALWPFVSNTEKMNRAAGLAPVRFEIETTKGSKRGESNTTGHQRVAGLALKWKEHPYEWIEGSRHVVLRVFEQGVLRWYVSEVQLERTPTGGTRLRNTVRLEPRGVLARVISKYEIGVKYRRKLDKVYTRIDRILAAGPRPDIDPVDPEITLPRAAQQRVEELARQLRGAYVDDRAVDALTTYLSHASDQDVARIRPIELARRLGVPEEAMIEATLHAAKAGALAMIWDVICPSCRIPSNVVESLSKIEEHGSCRTCNLSYDIDFSRAIELAFRASPEIRNVETRTYCIGGPAHFPHVAAQVRLQPGERFALPLALPAGYYLVRSPQLARGHELRVTSSGGVRRADISVGDKLDLPALTAGDQLLTLTNPSTREILVRVERAGDRAYALSAARAMSLAVFRDLFPDQSLAPGRLMSVTQATIVIAQVDEAQRLFSELGDSKAFPVATRFFEVIGNIAKEYGGSLIKTFGGMAICAFERSKPGVLAALAMQQHIDQNPITTVLRIKVAVHRGPMMALTQGGRLDYFGRNVEYALAIARDIPPTVVGLSAAVCQDLEVAEHLQGVPDQLGIAPVPDGTWVLHVQARRGDPRALSAALADTQPTSVRS